MVEMQSKLGLKHVSISGGEPGLDKRLTGLVEFLLANGFHTTITTNGTTRLSDRLAPAIQRVPEKVRIRVSIDGDAHVHDMVRGGSVFNKAVREIRRFQEMGAWVGVNTVVLPETISRGEALADVVMNLDVDQWVLITPVPEGSAAMQSWSAKEVLPRVLKLRSTIRASGYLGRLKIWNFLETPNTSVLIKTNGDIVLAGVRGVDDILLGSIFEFDTEAIANWILDAKSKNARCYFSWSGGSQEVPA